MQKMTLSKEHFDLIVNLLARKLDSNKVVKFYNEKYSSKFEYENNFLAYRINERTVKFIDLVSEFAYFTYLERVEFLDQLMLDAQESIDRASCSEVLLDYYMSKIESL